jgi:hypothetical protein
MVQISVVLGTDNDPEDVIKARPDINKYGVGLVIKPHQDVDTNSRIILLGAPNSISKKEALMIITTILCSAEDDMKRNDPDYDRDLFNETFPEFAIICAQPQGLPFVPSDDKKGYTPQLSQRRALHIMCSSAN